MNHTLAENFSAPVFTQTARQLAEALAPHPLFPWQERAIGESGVLTGADSLHLAPTGAGKTTIAHAAVAACLAGGGMAVHLVSTRSLARERGDALAQCLAPLGYRVAVSTRDDRSDDDAIRQGHADLVVTVYEKAQSLILQSPVFREKIRLLVADEAQLLADPQRGPAGRLLLEILRSAQSPPQILALSASASLRPQLEEALRLKAHVWEERSVPLQVGVLHLEKGEAEWTDHEGRYRSRALGFRVEPEEDLGDAFARLVAEAEKPVLAFFPTRREAMIAARSLAERSTTSLDIVASEAIATSPIGALLSRGVGLHTAEQTRAERRAVEQWLRSGQLPVCCCTTTLAEGINIAARTVFYVAPADDNAARRENCLGRAGRPGAGPGIAWVMARGGGASRRGRPSAPVCPLTLAAFLMAAGESLEAAATRVALFALPSGTSDDIRNRGLRFGLWDLEGNLTPAGRLIASGGIEAEVVSGWRTTLRRFPNGGGSPANQFLALGGSRLLEALPLSQDERLSARWITALVEELEAARDPLSNYFLDFLSAPDALSRRIHLAAKGALLALRGAEGWEPRRLEAEFLVPAGVIEEFLDQAAFALGQLGRLARDLGGALGELPPRIIPVRSANVVPVQRRPRLVLRKGSTGVATLDGRIVQLTPLQFRFLELLARNAGDGIPYERVERYVWDGGSVERQQISYFKSRVEKKLSEVSAVPGERFIETVASWGIRLLLARSEVFFEEQLAEDPLILHDHRVSEESNSVAWTVCL